MLRSSRCMVWLLQPLGRPAVCAQVPKEKLAQSMRLEEASYLLLPGSSGQAGQQAAQKVIDQAAHVVAVGLQQASKQVRP